MKSTIVVIFTLFACSLAQKISRGQCPGITVVEDFDFKRYSGKWFDILKYPHLFRKEICKEGHFGQVLPNGQSQVLYKEIINGRVRAVRGLAFAPNPVLGRLKITLKVPIAGDADTGYDILGTDYDNWALVYSCQEILGMKVEQAWMLSRFRELSFEGRMQIEQLITKNNLDPSSFEPTGQENCPDLDNMPFTFVA